MLWLQQLLFVLVAKKQDSWKITYLAELLSILLLNVHGHKRATLLPTYCSEANIKTEKNGLWENFSSEGECMHQIFEVPLEKLEKYSSFYFIDMR